MQFEMLKAYRAFKDKAILYSLKFKMLNKKRQIDNAPLIATPLSKKVKSQTIDFVDSDEQRIFAKAVDHLPKDWIWANTPISYSINSHGYRMREFDDIDWDNYMVSFGCSFTFGVGLPESETYSYRISQLTGMDLINAGVMAGGNDLILTNLYTLLQNAPKPPKLVVIGWSDISRKFFWGDDHYPMPYFSSLKLTSNHIWADSYRDYIRNETSWMQEFQEIKKQVDLLCKLSKVECWQFTPYYGLEFDNSITKIPFFTNLDQNLDISVLNAHFARDIDILDDRLAHPGIAHQNAIVKQFQSR